MCCNQFENSRLIALIISKQVADTNLRLWKLVENHFLHWFSILLLSKCLLATWYFNFAELIVKGLLFESQETKDWRNAVYENSKSRYFIRPWYDLFLFNSYTFKPIVKFSVDCIDVYWELSNLLILKEFFYLIKINVSRDQ